MGHRASPTLVRKVQLGTDDWIYICKAVVLCCWCIRMGHRDNDQLRDVCMDKRLDHLPGGSCDSERHSMMRIALIESVYLE